MLSNHINFLDKTVTVMYIKKYVSGKKLFLQEKSLPICLTYNMHSAQQVLSYEDCLLGCDKV